MPNSVARSGDAKLLVNASAASPVTPLIAVSVVTAPVVRIDPQVLIGVGHHANQPAHRVEIHVDVADERRRERRVASAGCACAVKGSMV